MFRKSDNDEVTVALENTPFRSSDLNVEYNEKTKDLQIDETTTSHFGVQNIGETVPEFIEMFLKSTQKSTMSVNPVVIVSVPKKLDVEVLGSSMTVVVQQGEAVNDLFLKGENIHLRVEEPFEAASGKLQIDAGWNTTIEANTLGNFKEVNINTDRFYMDEWLDQPYMPAENLTNQLSIVANVIDIYAHNHLAKKVNITQRNFNAEAYLSLEVPFLGASFSVRTSPQQYIQVEDGQREQIEKATFSKKYGTENEQVSTYSVQFETGNIELENAR
ncbi:MAG: hypothetical protein ACRCWQ_01145 [Bacilli bacterium]